MPQPRIAIVISSTRRTRFGDKPAHWLNDLARERIGFRYEVLDLRDHPLPFFDEALSPATEPARNPAAQKLALVIAGFDGFVFVTAEYNHGVPAVLKNTLDHVYAEWGRKPAGFVGYGQVGGARAIEQLRLTLIELRIAPLTSSLNIGRIETDALWKGEKTFDDFPYLAKGAGRMLDELEWWTTALAEGRRRAPEG